MGSPHSRIWNGATHARRRSGVIGPSCRAPGTGREDHGIRRRPQFIPQIVHVRTLANPTHAA